MYEDLIFLDFWEGCRHFFCIGGIQARSEKKNFSLWTHYMEEYFMIGFY